MWWATITVLTTLYLQDLFSFLFYMIFDLSEHHHGRLGVSQGYNGCSKVIAKASDDLCKCTITRKSDAFVHSTASKREMLNQNTYLLLAC